MTVPGSTTSPSTWSWWGCLDWFWPCSPACPVLGSLKRGKQPRWAKSAPSGTLWPLSSSSAGLLLVMCGSIQSTNQTTTRTAQTSSRTVTKLSTCLRSGPPRWSTSCWLPSCSEDAASWSASACAAEPTLTTTFSERKLKSYCDAEPLLPLQTFLSLGFKVDEESRLKWGENSQKCVNLALKLL